MHDLCPARLAVASLNECAPRVKVILDAGRANIPKRGGEAP